MQSLRLTTYQGKQIDVAFNPHSRRWERIDPESELMPGETPIRMYWANALARYVTIPD